MARLRERFILERDFRSFRRRFGHVLGHVPATGGGTALIASLSYSTYQAKLEAMFAKALQLKGLEPVVLTLPDATFARSFHELAGVRRFVTLDDYLDPALEAEAAEEASRLLEQVASSADLKAASFRDAEVGREAFSTVSRYLHEGGVDLTDEGARSLLGTLLPTAVRTTLASERLLAALEPQLVLFNERNYAEQGPVCDVALARGLDVLQFVSGFDDDSMVFKRYTAGTKGVHPRSLSDASWELVRALDWTPERDAELEAEFARRYDKTATFLGRWNQAWTEARPGEEIIRAVGLDPARKTAVIFSHLLWDANIFYGRDLFADQSEWFVETVKAACANDTVNWIVKLHPANVWKRRRDGVGGELDELRTLRERVGELPAHVHVLEPATEISTRSLFDVTDWGVTIRGSVGFELPCFGVPALTAGTGFYSGRGFTIDSDTAGDYLARLRAIAEIPPPTPAQVELARKHAHGLFRVRPTRFTSFRSVFQPVERVDRPFEASIEVLLRSPAELERAEDLRALGDWAVDSDALDYLAL